MAVETDHFLLSNKNIISQNNYKIQIVIYGNTTRMEIRYKLVIRLILKKGSVTSLKEKSIWLKCGDWQNIIRSY